VPTHSSSDVPEDLNVPSDVPVTGELGLVALAPALPAAAVERLPRGELGVPDLDADPFWRLVSAFVVDCRRVQTRRAYVNDLKAWYAWCTARELHPLSARRHDIACGHANSPNSPNHRARRTPASIARRLSCLSSFYGYAIEVDVLGTTVSSGPTATA